MTRQPNRGTITFVIVLATLCPVGSATMFSPSQRDLAAPTMGIEDASNPSARPASQAQQRASNNG